MDKDKAVDGLCNIVKSFQQNIQTRNGYYSQYKSEFHSHCIFKTENDIMSELVEIGFANQKEADEYIDLLIEEDNEKA